MAELPGGLGGVGNIVSGISSYKALAKGDIIGALSGGIFGGGGLFGGDKKHRPFSTGLNLPANLEGLGIPTFEIATKSFRGFGPIAVARTRGILSGTEPIIEQIAQAGFLEELNKPILGQSYSILGKTGFKNRMNRATSPSNKSVREQGFINAVGQILEAFNTLTTKRMQFLESNPRLGEQVNQLIRDNPNENPNKLLKGFFENVNPELSTFPQPQPKQPPPDIKGPATKAALNLASRFLRLPRRKKSQGFRFAGRGGGDISGLSQEEDFIIPSGFIRKQATTPSRTIDPRILEGIT